MATTIPSDVYDRFNVTFWSERDRVHIGIEDTWTDKTVADWWDDDAQSMIEGGFFSDTGFIMGREIDEAPLRDSVLEYALDAGIIKHDPKWGPHLPGEDRAEARKRDPELPDWVQGVLNLSSGTIAVLTGLRKYDAIEAAHREFIDFALDVADSDPYEYESWQEAWEDFTREEGGDEEQWQITKEAR